jgi:seryl-tRNA synthetase
MKDAHELANPADFKTISELAAFLEGTRAGMIEARARAEKAERERDEFRCALEVVTRERDEARNRLGGHGGQTHGGESCRFADEHVRRLKADRDAIAQRHADAVVKLEKAERERDEALAKIADMRDALAAAELEAELREVTRERDRPMAAESLSLDGMAVRG